jgi:hypothetical protein
MRTNNLCVFILVLIAFIVLVLIICTPRRKTKIKAEQEQFIGLSRKQSDKKSNFIVASLTTSPKRIHKIKPVLDRIMEQTLVPDFVVLNLPFVFKRTGETFGELPDFITSNPIIRINWCHDIGPATKILPTRDLFDDPETIIISIDDDFLYKRTMVETFLTYSTLFPDVVITGSSYHNHVDPPANVFEIPENTHFSEFMEGYSGILYKKKMLDKINITNEYVDNLPKCCFQSDDFIISNYLTK